MTSLSASSSVPFPSLCLKKNIVHFDSDFKDNSFAARNSKGLYFHKNDHDGDKYCDDDYDFDSELLFMLPQLKTLTIVQEAGMMDTIKI